MIAQIRAEQTNSVAKIQDAAVNRYMQGLGQQAGIAGNRASLAMKRYSTQIAQMQKAGKAPKQISESTAGKIAEVRAARRKLEELKGRFDDETGAGSFVSKRIPGTDSEKMDNALLEAQMKFRKAMTGTGMSDKERAEYGKLFPTSSTFDTAAFNRFETLISAMQNEEDAMMESLRIAGYDVPDDPRKTQDQNKAAAAQYAKEKGWKVQQ
jgi:hypothetical protein